MKTIGLLGIIALLLLSTGLLLTTAPADAQSGGPYDLTWNVIASGGTSTGGVYELSSAIGQAATGAASGGAYTLASGFWAGAVPAGTPVPSLYLPLIRR